MPDEADELHKRAIRNYRRRAVVSNDVNQIWSVDLIDLLTLWPKNSGYRYILCCVDVYTRYAYAVALKDKTADVVLRGLKSIGIMPQKIWADKGAEFYNAKMKAYLTSTHTEIYSTYGQHKSAIVERFNRTIKNWIFKYFTRHNTKRWVDILPELIDFYNKKPHRGLKGISPAEAMKPQNVEKTERAHNTIPYSGKLKQKYKVGYRVRVALTKGPFGKGYEPNWSKDIYVIAEVKQTDPVTYKVSLDGSMRNGSFYAEELERTHF